MAYDMRYPFIIPVLVGEYAGAVEELRWNCSATVFYLLSHWLKVLLHLLA